MISVQNHQLRLSGSKTWIWMVALLLCSGCAIFGPSSRKKDPTPTDVSEDKGVDIEKTKVDTVEWTFTPESEVPPITARKDEIKSTVKDSYNVALVAPFSAKSFRYKDDRLNARMTRMIEFYAGVKYAWQNKIQDIRVNLAVVDSQKDPQFAENFSSYEPLLNADVIIGPYFTDELQLVAEFAKQTGKVILSPWNTGNVAHDNPYYIQLRPSLATHAEALTKYVQANHQDQEVLLMCKDDDRDSITLTYFHQANNKLSHNRTAARFTDMKIQNISDPDLSDTLVAKIEEQGLRTFIIPNWNDEPFIISALAKINFAKADKDVTVFGLPQWMTLSKMDFNYYENLNVHVSSPSPLANHGGMSDALKQSFFSQYGTLPGEEVYYGMDVMRLVIHLLSKSGTLITEGLDSVDEQGNYQFDFVSIFGDDGESINHHENRFVQIVKFEDFRFVAADE